MYRTKLAHLKGTSLTFFVHMADYYFFILYLLETFPFVTESKVTFRKEGKAVDEL